MPVQNKSSSTPKEKQGTFRLEQLFGSKTRARLFGIFLNHPEDAFFVRELTRRIDAQLNSVRREIQNLIELGILREISAKEVKNKKVSDNKKYFQANTESILYNDLRALMQKAQILLNKNLVQEIDKRGTVDYLILTGKFVREVNIPVDLLIVGSIGQKALQDVIKCFEQELGDEVNFTLMPREEFLYRKQISDKFLFSVLESDKLVMIDRISETS
jgi:hypothetical protein